MNRPRDKFGNHDGQQHLRYVEVYTIDSDPDSPVQVKLLRSTDGETYITIGDSFRIGDTDTADKVTSGDRVFVTWRRDTMRWELLSGGIGDHYQLVRGQTTAAVADTDTTFMIDGVTSYEQHAATPTEPVTVAAPAGGVTLTEGQTIWAVYRESVGGIGVDWMMLDFGATNTPPLRRFVLTANKTLASTTATVKWLDDAGATTGSDLTIYDPEQQFSGRIADDLYTGSPGFHGIALLRTDLGAEESDRWEIIGMQRLAEFVVLTRYSAGEFHFVSSMSANDDWWSVAPEEVDGLITLDDSAGITGNLVNGDTISARLLDSDTSPPTYASVGAPDKDSKVAADGTDTTPAALIDKLYSGGAYDAETDQIVKFDVIDDGGTLKVRGAYTPGEGGGFSVIAGCGISIVGSDPKTFSFDYSIVDQSRGLRVDTSGPGCALIHSIMQLSTGVIEEPWISIFDPTEPFRPDVIYASAGQFTRYVVDLSGGKFDKETQHISVLGWKRHSLPNGTRTLILTDWNDIDWVVADDYLPFVYFGRVQSKISSGIAGFLGDDALIPGNGKIDVYKSDGITLIPSGEQRTVYNYSEQEILPGQPVYIFDQQYGPPIVLPIESPALVTVYIERSVDAATEIGLSSFEPAYANVELYELDSNTGIYSRGETIQVENHDVKTSLTVEPGKPLRGLATKNAYGKYVLHTQFCEPISQGE